MDPNKVLLSQKEIDTLLSFLLDKKDNVSGEVLDQASIDKLILLLRSDNLPKLRFDSTVPDNHGSLNSALIVLDGNENLGDLQSHCRLIYEIEPVNGYFKVICRNSKTKHDFNITPSCVEQLKYFVDEHSTWGFSIPPIIFDRIATLVQVKYSKDNYSKICEIFAETMFGDKKYVLPGFYLPTEQSLLQNMVTK